MSHMETYESIFHSLFASRGLDWNSKYLPQWAARERHYFWPASDVINDISSMEGYVVTVGSIEGENPDLDWRISYVTAENKLISNLNTIQFKLHIILKIIAKELIYPDFPVISSYVVKNIVLWVCELNPQSLFTDDLLFDQVRKCLSFMRTCLQNNHLPNYIIPDRNLIACRINVHSKRQLIVHLKKLLDDGRAIFSRLTIFKKHSPLALVLVCVSLERQEIKSKNFIFSKALKIENITFDDLTRSSAVSGIEFKFYQDESYFHITFEILSLLFPGTSFLEFYLSGDITRMSDVVCKRLKLYLS